MLARLVLLAFYVSALKCPDIKADVSAGTIILGIDGVKAEYTIQSELFTVSVPAFTSISTLP